jgi:DNA-binding NarL/FixJ family response regulator
MNDQIGSTPEHIRIVVVDDHPLFRDGLRRAFEYVDHIEVIGYFETGELALEEVPRLEPDVILLDINLPGMNGLQVSRQLQQAHSRSSVVILTAHHDTEQILHALRSGASAYCSKDIRPDKLVEVLEAVAAGYHVVDNRRMDRSAFKTWLTERIEDTSGPYTIDAEGHFIPLSPREMEILEYVTQGMINKQIAATLGISQQTVKNHMTSILKKLKVNDRTQAAVTAIRRGWVRVNDNDQQEL